MENLTIQTSQNVLITQNIATVGERMLATFVDYFLVFIYYLIIFYAINSLVPYQQQSTLTSIFMIPVMVYSLVSEILMQGQSLGKKLLKIQVVKIDGSQPTVTSYLLRWLFRLVDIFLLSGSIAVVTVIISGKGQRFGDMVAKTSVISLKTQTNLNKTIYVETPENYSLNFEGVVNLSQEDIRTILDVLKHYQANISSNQAAILVRETATIIEQKVEGSSFTNPVDFLRRVVYDFNLIHKK